LVNDEAEGRAIEGKAEESFNRYHELWENRFAEQADKSDPVKTRPADSREETLPAVVRLREYNNTQIQKSENDPPPHR